MSTNSQSGNRSSRLNPFVFPSDTDFRFVLLIVSVIGVSLIIYQLLYNTIPGVLARSLETQARCKEKAMSVYPYNVLAQRDAFEQCMVPADRVRALGVFGAVVILFIVAGFIYWLIPTWKMWRSHLQPLSAEDAPEVLVYLAELCQEVKIDPMPIFVWNPLDPTRNGQAFGRWGRYYISLTGGLVAQFFTDRAAFRAVMLHEISHLRNGDVNKTYFSVAIWQAFVAVALVPFVIGQPYAISRLGKSWSTLLGQGWRLLALTLLVYLTRNSVLRAREIYADLRASVWDSQQGALRRVIMTLDHPSYSRFRSLLSVHPVPGERIRILDETDRLFRLGFWDAFAIGITAMIAYSGFQFWLGYIFRPTLFFYFLEVFVAALIFAPLVVGVVGSGVWRSTFLTMVRGKSRRGVGYLGLGVGLGAILGQNLNIIAYSLREGASLGSINWFQSFSLNVIWNIVLLVSLLLFVYWFAVGASTWLEVAINSKSPRPFYRLGLAVAGLLLALWFAFLFFSYPGGIESNISLISYSALIRTPYTFLGLIMLWSFPLAAWFWQRRVSASVGSIWAFLDPPPRLLRLPLKPPLRLGRAFLLGLLGGGLFCVLSFIFSLGLIFILSDDMLVSWAVYGQAVLSVLIQVGVSAVVAIRIKRLSGLHGLFAALVAGFVMAVGASVIYVFLSILSGTPISDYIQSPPYGTILLIMSLVINFGTLFTIPTAWGSSKIVRWVLRR
ncbi:MAG: M48 family metalloprotease [Anaerolineales bacterium]|jgi:Zn-dependent protease with chaperone function